MGGRLLADLPGGFAHFLKQGWFRNSPMAAAMPGWVAGAVVAWLPGGKAAAFVGAVVGGVVAAGCCASGSSRCSSTGWPCRCAAGAGWKKTDEPASSLAMQACYVLRVPGSRSWTSTEHATRNSKLV